MLMPLLVRLTDSEIEVIDLVGSQALHGIEDRRVVIEAAGSAGLAIDHLPRPRPHHRHLLVSDGNTGVAAASASAGGTIPAGLPAMSTRFLDDGRICLSNNAAERGLRCVAVGRRNWTFAGSDEGGRRAAAVYSLTETCTLNDADPRAWLADVLARLPDHPAHRIGEMLPWAWKARHDAAARLTTAVAAARLTTAVAA